MSATSLSTAEKSLSPAPLLLYRTLALFYDLWPALALWLMVATVFTLGYTWAGHEVRENIPAFSALQWLLWLCCWLVTGIYATVSWKYGAQTLGMRPWRLHLRTPDQQPPSWRALWLRYVIGSVSLACAGIGFYWALFDRHHCSWHDRCSGTYLIRLPKTKH